MKIIKPSAEIISPCTPDEVQQMYRRIERAGRTCYKSEDKITSESAKKFVSGLIKRGHEAMIEHASMSVRFIVDRGVSHELVRHRIASFAQESTRYVNYSKEKYGKELAFIEPCFFSDIDNDRKNLLKTFSFENPVEPVPAYTQRELAYHSWYNICSKAEETYLNMLDFGCKPEEARDVLPMSVKTELVITASLREWRHIFKLRAAETTGPVHPQMKEIMVPLLKVCQSLMPEFFEDIKIQSKVE